MSAIPKRIPVLISLLLASQISFALSCQSELQSARQKEIRGNPYAKPYTSDEEQQIVKKDMSESIKRVQEFVEYTTNMNPAYAPYYRCILDAKLNSEKGGDKSNQGSPVTAGRPPSVNSAGVDEVTPQVPGCPKYVSKLNIEWRRKPGTNPQLNIWEARNVSDKFTFRVTYRVDGANTDLPTLNPGDTAEAWGLRGEPPFVVRNFYDMKLWGKSNSQEKSLQCSLAIRPQ